MIDFLKVIGSLIPEGKVKSLSIGGKLVWQRQEESVTVSGTWVFNENLDMRNINEEVDITFKSNDSYYFEMGISANDGELNYRLIGATGSTKVYSTTNGWENDAYRTINFDVLESGDQVVSSKFYAFLTANATKKEHLTAPTISLNGDILTMTATDEKTESFAIFVGGVEKKIVGVN